jgi:hypothetical protein
MPNIGPKFQAELSKTLKEGNTLGIRESTDLTVKVTECESSCQGVSNIFDNADKQIKTNTRNIIHQDQRN